MNNQVELQLVMTISLDLWSDAHIAGTLTPPVVVQTSQTFGDLAPNGVKSANGSF